MLEDVKNISISDYDYTLPDEFIAKYPARQRDHSKLLCLRGDTLSEHLFLDLPSLLPSEAMLVFNNTRVIHARLFFHKSSGATIEVFCLEPNGMPEATAFEQRSYCSWLCFIGNNKKWKDGSLSLSTPNFTLSATRRHAVGNAWIVDFTWDGSLSFAEVVEQAGVIPLPPYMNRAAESSDAIRYQTVYAHYNGSVAAPTAGLHFTQEVLSAIAARGIATEYITLHVGAGTFKPVSTDTIGEHEMHVEPIHVSLDNLRHLVAHLPKPIVAVGTTSVRTLESLYWFGVQLSISPDVDEMRVEQWTPYRFADASLSATDALALVMQWMQHKGIDEISGYTRLLIAPGYTYRVVSGLVTNFHQPRSTLLLLVSALIGDQWHRCYEYALTHNFRFLSYGDCCLFLP